MVSRENFLKSGDLIWIYSQEALNTVQKYKLPQGFKKGCRTQDTHQRELTKKAIGRFSRTFEQQNCEAYACSGMEVLVWMTHHPRRPHLLRDLVYMVKLLDSIMSWVRVPVTP